MTRIFLEGFTRAGAFPERAVVSDVSAEALNHLLEKFPDIEISPNDNGRPASCDIVFLAVHPPVIKSVLPELSNRLQTQSLLVSLAPKFTIANLASGLGGFRRIARMIPNAPSIMNAGFNPIAFSSTLSEDERGRLLALLNCLGECPVVHEENLEAYAVLTAMGPTYFWFQWSELTELAVSFGLGKTEAQTALASMLAGAVKAMYQLGLSPEEVMGLIPVKPLAEEESQIRGIYQSRVQALFQKLRD